MLLYAEQDPQETMYGEKPTPAHLYASINNFNNILDDMMKGAIPTNTKFVYPTMWKADIIELEKEGKLPKNHIR